MTGFLIGAMQIITVYKIGLKNSFFPGVILLIFFFVLKAGAGESLSNYTADMVIDGVKTEIAYLDRMMLIKNPQAEDIINISMPEAKKFIVMSTSNDTYYESPIKPDFYALDVVVEKTKRGSQVIDGHSCTKYEGVFYQKGKPDEKNEMIEWQADDLGGLVIKVKMRDYQAAKQNIEEYTTMELKHIKPGEAKKEMFQIPEYYRKVKLLKEVLE